MLVEARTVFIPKKDYPEHASDCRSITVASVPLDWYEIGRRPSIAGDGTAEYTVIKETRYWRSELNVVALVITKAFDSVSHFALCAAMTLNGLPSGFIDYMMGSTVAGSRA